MEGQALFCRPHFPDAQPAIPFTSESRLSRGGLTHPAVGSWQGSFWANWGHEDDLILFGKIILVVKKSCFRPIQSGSEWGTAHFLWLEKDTTRRLFLVGAPKNHQSHTC